MHWALCRFWVDHDEQDSLFQRRLQCWEKSIFGKKNDHVLWWWPRECRGSMQEEYLVQTWRYKDGFTGEVLFKSGDPGWLANCTGPSAPGPCYSPSWKASQLLGRGQVPLLNSSSQGEQQKRQYFLYKSNKVGEKIFIKCLHFTGQNN